MNNRPTFGGEVGGGCGCVLFAIALILLFNIGGATTAIVHHFFGG